MIVDVVLVLAGFAAGVVVSQLGLVALVLVGRRLLRRRGRRPTVHLAGGASDHLDHAHLAPPERP